MWGATNKLTKPLNKQLFQSTLPVWGATTVKLLNLLLIAFQSTLPVWGATSGRTVMFSTQDYFNPRSPCGERPMATLYHGGNEKFQSTLPVWGATYEALARGGSRYISIHAPRVGSDSILKIRSLTNKDFNPRSPCGERLRLLIINLTSI